MQNILLQFLIFALGCAHRAPPTDVSDIIVEPSVEDPAQAPGYFEPGSSYNEQFEAVFTVVRDGRRVTHDPSEPLLVGDRPAIELTWTGDFAYLLLVSIGPNGDVFKLVPSSVTHDDTLPRDVTRLLGPFVVTEPVGTETFLFIVTSERVAREQLMREVRRFVPEWIKDPRAQYSFEWHLGGEAYRGMSEKSIRSRSISFTPLPAQSSSDVTVTTGFLFLKSTFAE